MRLTIVAVGRLGRAPEGELTRLYAERATAAGRALSLGPLEIIEVESRKPGRDAEGAALLAAVPGGGHLIACDERGAAWPSRRFADHLAELRDRGLRQVSFLIGGADGLSEEARGAAAERLAFGAQTWPHALARVMLAEQLYRAVTILGGSPYHRD